MPFTSNTNPKVKLTPSQVLEIKALIKKGVAVQDIATQYTVSPSAISRIKRNKTWRKI